jgi:hypothetical protein
MFTTLIFEINPLFANFSGTTCPRNLLPSIPNAADVPKAERRAAGMKQNRFPPEIVDMFLTF